MSEDKKFGNILNDVSMVSVMNTVLDALIIIDSKGVISAFNKAASRIFGYSSSEVVGQKVNMLMPEPYQSEHDSYLGNYLGTGEKKVIGIGREVRGRRKNGEVFPMELGVNNMLVNDNIMFVGTLRDISERKQSEESIKSYIKKLKQSNQELDDFAYIASHDLKEPLRGLSNNALFLKEDFGDKLGAKAVERIDRIIFLAERMEQLVNDLLHFSRLGQQDLAVAECNLEDLVQDTVSMLDSIITEKNVEVTIQKDMPIIICDKVRMREVFHNLITNAIKYNNKSSKSIEIGHTKDSQFFVKDNGIGIPEKFREEVFRIFKRLNAEDDSTKGTGVGLTFVKKIIERHGGNIWIESDEGDGTTFHFTLPRRTAND